MRRSLRWILGGTVLTSAIAWLWPQNQQSATTPVGAVTNLPPPPVAGTATANTPRFSDVRLEQAELLDDATKGATFDPFVGVVAPPPPSPSAPAAPPPPPPPAPPAMGYRFFGHIDGVDGVAEIYLAKGDNVVHAQPGLKLDDGYVVESVSASGASVVYPPLGTRVVIPLPAETGLDSR